LRRKQVNAKKLWREWRVRHSSRGA